MSSARNPSDIRARSQKIAKCINQLEEAFSESELVELFNNTILLKYISQSELKVVYDNVNRFYQNALLLSLKLPITYFEEPKDKLFLKRDTFKVLEKYAGCLYSIKNDRSYMEDTYSVNQLGNDVNLFGVYDGHGGAKIAEKLRDELPEFLYNKLLNINLYDGSLVAKIIQEAFVEFDMKLFDRPEFIGSTATLALVTPKLIYTINLGDSRTVVATKKHVISTEDHKPDSPIEKERVENAGGQVINMGVWRLSGMLAVARSFGDFVKNLKLDEGNNYSGNLLSSMPDVKVVPREPNTKIILASDGLWDVVSSAETVDNDYNCKDLVSLAVRRGSRDNITVLQVLLN